MNCQNLTSEKFFGRSLEINSESAEQSTNKSTIIKSKNVQIIPTSIDRENIEVIFVNSIEVLDKVAKNWAGLKWLAVDTEFERRTSFYAKLALVQIFDGIKIYLIDPLAVNCPDSLKQVIESPSITKILHSSKEDLEVLFTAWGCRLQGLFDTQIANNFITGELSLGYAKLTEEILAVVVDKQATNSDWIKRPLAEKQLDYAAKDVLYLPEIYQSLQLKISNHSSYSYFKAECEEYVEQAIERIKNFTSYRDAKDVWRLNEAQLPLFKVLFEWREKTARDENRTRNHIIKEPELVQLAIAQPSDVEQLKSLLSLHPRSIRLYAKQWISIIENWQKNKIESQSTLPIVLNPRDIKGLKELANKIEKIVENVARDSGVSKTLLFSKRLIRKLAFSMVTKSEYPTQWTGWRRALLESSVENQF